MEASSISEVPFEALEGFVLGLGQRIGENPTCEELGRTANELRDLAMQVHWDAKRFPTATPGKLLMRDVVISPDGGPSLYLVSESPGVVDPPHEHCTWTIVIGIQGCELNTMYTIVDESKRLARKASERMVGPGDTIVMDEDVIHSIRVVDGVSTFHLHMYGSPISARRPFPSRCYRDIDSP
jgi:predicted metal-dependent enzyme (double-stranded beta helix superfamily)